MLRDKRTEKRDLSAIGIHLFGMYRNYSPNSALEEHDHQNAIEICYLEKGTQTYFVKDTEYRMVGGEVFLTFPYEKHSTGCSLQQRGCLYWIQLDMGCDHLLGLEAESADLLKECLLSVPCRPFKISRETASKFKKAYLYMTHEDPLQLIVANALLVLFFYEMTAQTVQSVNYNQYSVEIQNCIEYMEKNMEENITVLQLANFVNFSESYLKLKFKQEVGIPPKEYLLRQKIEQSKSLLQHQSITETALKLGFSSSQHFTKSFRDITGITPTQYKETL